MKIFIAVFSAMAAAFGFYQFGLYQGKENCSIQDETSSQSFFRGGDIKKSTEYFSVGRGKSILLKDEVVFVVSSGSCRGRSDLICVVINGEKKTMSLGSKQSFQFFSGKCALELTQFPSTGSDAEFKLGCETDA